MGWEGDHYIYTSKILRAVAQNYQSIYTGLALSLNYEITNPWSLAEYKADFDMSLSNLGFGKWKGEVNGYKFSDFRYFPRLQRVVIADIFDKGDEMGIYDVSGLRGYAYRKMKRYLNGE